MKAEISATRPPMHATPYDALGPMLREAVFVEGRTFLIERPSESDRLLDHPAIEAACEVDGYMPYWADLWPAARMLAKAVLREPWPAGAHALEVGCGLGLAGIAALAAGLRVTFSDYDATALRVAADNARLNGFRDFATLQMDWRFPPDDLQVPVVLGSDLIYEMRNVAPLVALVERVLHPDGLCLLTDQDRVPSHVLRQTLTEVGLPFATRTMHAGEPGGRRLKGTLYRIWKAPREAASR